jgi:HAD superfamily hydrolase (TIGR01484 family)
MAGPEIRAVIFDIDGTAMPNERRAEPSERLIKAIEMTAERGLHLSCATGRNYVIAKRILDSLNLSDPCIVSAGTQIVEPDSGKEVWSVPMTQEACEFALEILAPYKLKAIVDGETYDEALTTDKLEARPYRLLDVQYVPKEDLPLIIEKLSADSSIISIPVHSNDPDLYFLHVTNRLATKQHAVEQLVEILGVPKESVAGIGDGLNDMELFKSVGLKVAMGNAVTELKDAADMVIASVEQDGLAEYLEGLNR